LKDLLTAVAALFPFSVCLGCHCTLCETTMVPCPQCQFPLCGKLTCYAESASSHHSKDECSLFAASGFKPKISSLELPHFIYQVIGILRVLFAKRRSEEAREAIDRLKSHGEKR
jgi:hypothetical protein